MINVISWNVNGIRAIKEKGFFSWLKETSPDIICLQETKASPEVLTKDFFELTDKDENPYYPYFVSAKKKGYSGNAIYTRHKPKAEYTMNIPEFDDEGRTLALDFGKFVAISAYFPNSQEAGARIDYKVRYCKAMQEYVHAFEKEGKQVLLSGDYNVAHKPIDLEYPKANEGNPGYLPEERAWMDEFTESGFVDTFRLFNKEPKQYTWWSYRMRAREKNVGWRIDYHTVNKDFADKVRSSTILNTVMGSDHCPIKIELDIKL